MDMKQHLNVAAALNIGLGVVGLVLAIIAFVFLAGIGLISGDPDAMPVLTIIAFVAGGFLFIFSVPDIIGGIGLAKRKSWSRILVLILSVLKLVNFPVGTAVGVYSIWVLVQDEATQMLDR